MGLFGPSKKDRERVAYLESQLGLLQHQIRQMGAGRLLEVNGMVEAAEAYFADLQVKVQDLEQVHQRTATSVADGERQVRDLKRELGEVSDQINLADDGYYVYPNPAEASVRLGQELAEVREQAKKMVRSKNATSATSGFTFNNSIAKGNKFVSDMSKLMLRSYNAEAENGVLTVRAGNLQAAQTRLNRAKDQAERLGKMIELKVNPSYHKLRSRELALTSQHLEAKRQEKEAEREHRAQLREERLAQREFAEQKAKLGKERSHYENAIRQLLEQGRSEEAAALQAELERIDSAIADIDYREANIRAGYVYVISNIGAFGDHMVKIGMTRRLEPMDRVKELGDASVPFGFDVHALFFSEDAVTVEAELHRRFAAQRVNQINLRREFFYATPAEVRDVLAEIAGNLLEFREEPEAEQFRLSLAARESGVAVVNVETPRRGMLAVGDDGLGDDED